VSVFLLVCVFVCVLAFGEHSFISPQNVIAKKKKKKQNLTNLSKQNKNSYSNSLSLQFVLCIFTTHCTVDYYKHEI